MVAYYYVFEIVAPNSVTITKKDKSNVIKQDWQLHVYEKWMVSLSIEIEIENVKLALDSAICWCTNSNFQL
jgi:hypothetical protein